jgi:hypothetical protein
MNNTTKLQIAFIAVIALTGLLGCGPQKSGEIDSSNFSSTGNGNSDPGPDISTMNVDQLTANGYSLCSQDMNNDPDIGGRIMLFYNNSSRLPNHNYVHIKFDRFPNTFSGTSSNPSFAVWASTVSAEGNETTSAQLKFGFERINGTNNFTPISDLNYTGANWGDLVNLINRYQLPYTTGAAMMANYSIVVDLSQYSTTPNLVIKMALYDSNRNLLKYVNGLVPVFKANPNLYATNHPTTLLNLHPLRTMLGSTWTEQQFVTESARNCF